MINALFLKIHKLTELILNNMLTNVTKYNQIGQLLRFTGFIIHVDSFCIGECAYA